MTKISLPRALVLCCLFLPGLNACSRSMNSGEQLDITVENASRVPIDPQIESTSEAMHSYLIGELSYDKEDFAGALKNFSHASDLLEQPVPRLNAKLAELYVRSHDLQKALIESEKAISVEPSQSRHLLLKAGILDALDRSEEAVGLYEKVISAQPQDSDAYLLLSNLYIKKREFDRALTILSKFVSQKPQEAEGYYYLGLAYELKGDLAPAEVQLKKAFELSGHNAAYGLDVVRVLLKKKDYENAKRICNLILEKNPENLLARRTLGELLIGENQLDEALEQLQTLQNVEDDASDTRFKIALIHLEKHNFVDAIRGLNLVLAQKPEHPQARYYLATAYAATGRRKEAVNELEKIKQPEAMFVKARTLAAFILRQDGNLPQAEKAIREALAQSPDSESIFSYLIMVLRDSAQYAQAEKLIRTALEKKPKDEKLLFQFGVVQHDLGNEKEAREAMERILREKPDHTDAMNYLAYSLADASLELDRALQLATQAVKSKPTDGYYLDTLGWIYFKRGDLAQAEKYLAQAVKQTGDDPVILEHYADVLSSKSDKTAALEAYRTALERARESKDREMSEAVKRIEKKVDELSRRSNVTQPSSVPLLQSKK